MNPYIKPKRIVLLVLVLFCMLLATACVPQSQSVTIAYPTGEEAPFNAPKNIYPIAGSDYFVCNNKDSNVTSPIVSMEILSKDHEVIYRYDDFEFAQAERGEMASDGSIWVVCEAWRNQAPLGRYTNGFLINTQLFQINLETGEILFRKETQNGDLYLTTRENRCYFYHGGSDPKSELLGLKQTPVVYANIYYRGVDDWDNPVVVSTFAYGGAPDEYETTVWLHQDEDTENPLKAMGVAFDKLIKKDVEIGYKTQVDSFRFKIAEDKITIEVVGTEFTKGNPNIVDKEKVFYSSEILLTQ